MIENHIAKIKEKLQEVVYLGSPLLVSSYYISSADKYPFFFITDGKITNNQEGDQYEIGTDGSYYRLSEYEINAVFSVQPENIATIQDTVRAVSGLLIAKLSGSSMLSGGVPWTDFNFRDASAPINGVDIGLTDNCIIRAFRVEVEDLIDIPS